MFHTCLLVNLNCGSIRFDSNDFADKVIVADSNLESVSLMPFISKLDHTNSYMATPIMFSATTTGLRRVSIGVSNHPSRLHTQKRSKSSLHSYRQLESAMLAVLLPTILLLAICISGDFFLRGHVRGLLYKPWMIWQHRSRRG